MRARRLLVWHNIIAALVASSVLGGCTPARRATAPSVAPESRDASRSDDAALDARDAIAVDAVTMPAPTQDASGDVAEDPNVRFTLRQSAFVRSGQYDLPMRDPPVPAPASMRSGRAPTLAAAVAALRAQRASAARFQPEGGFSALGDGRFALIARRLDRGYRRSPAFELHIFSENAGPAQLEGSAQVPTANLFVGESGASGCPPAILAREVRDADNDGEPELVFVLRYCLMASCASGYVAFEYLVVYDLTPGPRLALMVERRKRGQGHEHDARSRAVTWRDVNGDGHPDVIARGRDCLADYDRAQRYLRGEAQHTIDDIAMMSCSAPERACAEDPYSVRVCQEHTETALWDPATDAWRVGTDGAERMPDQDCSGNPLPEQPTENAD